MDAIATLEAGTSFFFDHRDPEMAAWLSACRLVPDLRGGRGDARSQERMPARVFMGQGITTMLSVRYDPEQTVAPWSRGS